MKAWLRCFVWCMEGLLLLGVVYFEPTFGVRGMLHREAFFEDRPTSYWRNVVERDLHTDPNAFFVSRQYAPPTPWQRFTNWVRTESRVDSSHQLFNNPAAADVLAELAEDSSPQIAGFARDAIGLENKLQLATLLGDFEVYRRNSRTLLSWIESIRTHNLKRK